MDNISLVSRLVKTRGFMLFFFRSVRDGIEIGRPARASFCARFNSSLRFSNSSAGISTLIIFVVLSTYTLSPGRSSESGPVIFIPPSSSSIDGGGGMSSYISNALLVIRLSSSKSGSRFLYRCRFTYIIIRAQTVNPRKRRTLRKAVPAVVVTSSMLTLADSFVVPLTVGRRVTGESVGYALGEGVGL